jgi:DNA/RNA endonuclease YhcR with UshA esterase domain
MLLRQERLALSLLIVVAIGLSLGSFWAAGIDKGTLAREFCQTYAEGTLVSIEGTVDELRWTQTGGHLNLKISETPVFLPAEIAAKLTIQKGDQVLIYGILQNYRGEKEIVVQELKDVKIIGKGSHS